MALSTDEFDERAKNKRTYFSYEKRKAMLEAIRYVDLVIPAKNRHHRQVPRPPKKRRNKRFSLVL